MANATVVQSPDYRDAKVATVAKALGATRFVEVPVVNAIARFVCGKQRGLFRVVAGLVHEPDLSPGHTTDDELIPQFFIGEFNNDQTKVLASAVITALPEVLVYLGFQRLFERLRDGHRHQDLGVGDRLHHDRPGAQWVDLHDIQRPIGVPNVGI